MKAIILAAGKGERMHPLTEKMPKPLLVICGKPILLHIFEALPEEITEVVVVVNYLGDQIKKYLGKKFLNRKVTYITGSKLGTAYSLLVAEKRIKREERFLVVYGDEIVSKADIENCIKEEFSVVILKSVRPEAGGVVEIDEEGYVVNIFEKQKKPTSNIVVGGIMVINRGIFECTPLKNNSGEFYLSSMLDLFSKRFRVKTVFSENFLGDITFPCDIERIEKKKKGGKNDSN